MLQRQWHYHRVSGTIIESVALSSSQWHYHRVSGTIGTVSHRVTDLLTQPGSQGSQPANQASKNRCGPCVQIVCKDALLLVVVRHTFQVFHQDLE